MSERVSPRKCGDGAALGRLVESGMSDECALTSGALRDARLDFPRAGGLRSSVETARNVQDLQSSSGAARGEPGNPGSQ